jgi:polyisoprenoid-binding protein YceI
VKFKKDGTYNVTVTGNLTIKETTKSITAPGTITVKGGKITANASFPVTLGDFSVNADGKKIAKDAKVVVNAELN